MAAAHIRVAALNRSFTVMAYLSQDSLHYKNRPVSLTIEVSLNKACFKRRVTAMLSWLECGSIAARH